MDDPTVARLIEHAYAAALDEELWPEWSNAMMAAFGAQGSVFGTVDPSAQSIVSAEFKFPERDMDAIIPEYVGEMAPHDPVLTRLLGDSPDGIFTDADARRSDDLNLRRYFSWQAARIGIHHNATAVATIGGGLRAGIALHRSKARGAFGGEEGRRLLAITPHMGAALRLGLRHRQLLDEAWWEGLSVRSGEAALLIDAAGAILHMTRAAEGLATARGPVRVRGARLYAADPAGEARLRRTLTEAADDSSPRAGAVILSRSAWARAVYVIAQPLPRARRHRAPFAAAALVRIVDPGRRSGLSAEQRDLFGLTGREARCAELLLEGHTLETLAQVLSISRNTARNHLHALFRKTGTNRQADLLRLLMAIG